MSTADRFNRFLSNICLTDAQKTDGVTKRESVCRALNANYYASSSGTANSRYVGSWGKTTRIRPPRDVDVLFELPTSVYNRFEGRTGNKQSQLLQEVKTVLSATFPNTNIRGDGPVVMVPFVSFAVELLPAFRLTNDRFWIPVTADGGKYVTTDPDAELQHIK
ncbi:MAG: nucleotidyltransferase [Alphaproteobacteria bacterium]|nr:nucleotidyltransferase [Alphaproteobacteria bacterium]